MKRNLFLVGLALGTAVTLVGCSQSSPTAPKQPTPTAYGITLTVSPSVAGINETITAVALVTVAGSAAPDGTPVTFSMKFDASNSLQGSAGFVTSPTDTTLAPQVVATTVSGRAVVPVKATAGGAVTIIATVPNKSATSVKVHFLGSGGSQIAITSVLPNRGKPQGGDQVVIGGQGFVQPLSVSFIVAGTAYPATVTAVAADGSSITLLTPQIPTAAGDQVASVQVTLGAVVGVPSSATLSNAFTFGSDTGTPQLFSVVPNSGSSAGGDTIALTGKNFAEPLQVNFVFAAATVPGQVVAVQHGADGYDIARVVTPKVTISSPTSASITITNALGKSGTFANAFTFTLPVTGTPVIFYISPAYGSVAGNDTVTIYGANFFQPLTVQIGSTFESVQSVMTDSITIVTRPVTGNTPTGAQDVIVNYTNPADGKPASATLPGAFTYIEGQTPQLFVLSPNLGPLEGGTRVTITGTGFQYPVQVLFGTLQAQVVSNNFNQVVCISPSITATQPTTPTSVGVTVTNTGTGKASNSLQFTYGQAMFISSIAPGTGPDTGGTQVTVFGQGFVGPLALSLAGTPAQVVSVAGTQIIATSGAVLQRSCSPITGSVQVTNIDSNVSATGASWTYTPLNPLITAASSTCANGGSTGCTITVSGSNFTSGMRIVFTNPPMTLPATFVSSTQITGTLTTSFESAGITYRTVSCGTNGTQNVATAIDVQVLNTSNKCTDTLPGALTVTPSNTSCVTPPVTPTVTLTPTSTDVSIAGGLPKTLGFTITVTPAAAVTVSLTYGGSFVFSPAGPATVITNTSGVATFSVTAPNTVTSGDSATIIASYGSAVSQQATVNITP